jgi:AraC-like DNA-binding protein
MSGLDLLSDSLGVIRARSASSRGFTAGGYPWALRWGPAHQLKLHVAKRGDYWMLVDDREPVPLHEGDVAITNGAVSVVVASDPAVPPCEADRVFGADPAPVLRFGNSRGDLRSDGVIGIGGHVRLDTTCERPILAALPGITRVTAGDPAAGALGHLLQQLLRERSNPRPGSEYALDRYAELVLLEVMRATRAADDVPRAGWLQLISDPQLRPALTLMHAQPAYPWGLVELARAVSMSRSTFASRFREVAGMPPLRYLHQWRMQLAQAALRDTGGTIAALASRLGYASESSFNHAFTRTLGMSPSEYRALQRPVHDVKLRTAW